jgi:hypothetical protein
MLALLQSPESWIAFLTLSLLETVLGIDNVIFLSILVGRLPAARQRSARVVGLAAGDADAPGAAVLDGVADALTAPLFSVPAARFPGAT